jgi:hypothetical protein
VIVEVCASGVLGASQFAGVSLGTRWPVPIRFQGSARILEPASQTRTSGVPRLGAIAASPRRPRRKAAVSRLR